MIKTITYDDYLRLIGLLTLAADHRRMLDAIEHSALRITGEEPNGHTSDCVWGQDYSAQRLLELLDIAAPTLPATTPEDAAGQTAHAMRIVGRARELLPEE
jgi:hypothetical protein